METIGSRIKSSREKRGLAQQALAEAAGVSRAAVSQWESGQTKGLKPENLVAVADTLGVSIHWLVTGKERDQAAKEAREAIAEYRTKIDPELAKLLQAVENAFNRNSMTSELLQSFQQLFRTLPAGAQRPKDAKADKAESAVSKLTDALSKGQTH